jgi:hypothetical protein
MVYKRCIFVIDDDVYNLTRFIYLNEEQLYSVYIGNKLTYF